jgi:hypothetical protein
MGLVIRSTDNPLHPAACLVFFAALGLNNAGLLCACNFSALRLCKTFALNTSVYRLRAVSGTGVGREDCFVGLLRAWVLWVELDVKLWIEERSDVDVAVDVDVRAER